MKISINAMHIIAVSIALAAYAFGLPWFFSVPLAITLSWGATKATSLLDVIDGTIRSESSRQSQPGDRSQVRDNQ